MASRAAKAVRADNAIHIPGANVSFGQQDGMDVEIPPNPLQYAEGASFQETDDGGGVINFSPAKENDAATEDSHDDNLAEIIDESELNKLASKVLDWLDADKKSRSEWENLLAKGLEFLGLEMKDRTTPFAGAAGVYDPILLEAVLRSYANSSAELLPASGPVKTQIIGQPTEEIEEQASRVQTFFNYYVLEGAPEWLESSNQLLLWRAIAGSTFRKTYQHPILNRPVSDFIQPTNFVVSFNTDDLDTCPRASHIIDMNARDMKMRQLSGFYREVELGDPQETDDDGNSSLAEKSLQIQGMQPQPDADDIDYRVVEMHVDLDLVGFEHTESDASGPASDDKTLATGLADADNSLATSPDGEKTAKKTGLPLPYIISVEESSRKVLSIRRNWKKGDRSYQKIQYFTHFKFLPGLGFYGIGYAHILGNTAKAATSLQRQMIDAATLEMFPGGLRVKGMRVDDNNVMIGPCEFREIDTGGMPIQQAISPMPYKGPSPVSFQLWEATRENGRGLGSMTEVAVGEGRQDAPVGTTLALLEAANRLQSITVKNGHRAFRREFKLIGALFGQFLPDEPYPWPVQGGPHVIMRADFSERVDIIPVSDPNITSSAQRLMRAEAYLRFATQAPALFDQYQSYRQMLVEMGTDSKKIDLMLPRPEEALPTDPLTENMNALNGKPVKAAAYQDHQAHIKAHQVLSEQVPALAAHIAEHMALAMRQNVQKQLGVELPPEGTKLPPQIENHVAVLVAQALEQLNEPQGKEPTPGQIAMAEIKVEAARVDELRRSNQAKEAVTSYQATLKLKSDREERATREWIAGEKLKSDRAERAARAFAQRKTF